MRPSGTPIRIERISERTITSSAVRAPQTTREKTSKNWSFVPNQYSLDGGASLGSFTPSTLVWLKSYGAIHGAKIAHTRNTIVISTPSSSIHLASPWVFQMCRKNARISTSLAGRPGR